jgi:hypothetical protein
VEYKINEMINLYSSYFKCKFHYYGPNIQDEFHKISYPDNWFPECIELCSYNYDINKYVDITKKYQIPIKNNLGLYNYRIISYFDQLINLLNFCEIIESDNNMILLIRYDSFHHMVLPKLSSLRLYSKVNKIYGSLNEQDNLFEDKCFVLNKYSHTVFKNRILLDLIIDYCRKTSFPEGILKAIFCDLNHVNTEIMFPTFQVNNFKYTRKFEEIVKNIYY